MIHDSRIFQVLQVRKDSSTPQCLAKEETCHKCQKQGHFAVMCRTVRSVSVENDEAETKDPAFLGATGDCTPQSLDSHTNGKPTEFQIDTGGDVTVITKELYATK